MPPGGNKFEDFP